MTGECSMKGEGGRKKYFVESLEEGRVCMTWKAEAREITDYDVR